MGDYPDKCPECGHTTLYCMEKTWVRTEKGEPIETTNTDGYGHKFECPNCHYREE